MSHFQLKEFACPCCGEAPMKEDFLASLEELREAYGSFIIITSGYRCENYNRSVGGKPNSQHIYGNAADLACANIEQLWPLANEMFDAVGDGRKRGFIHVDGRRDRKRSWSY